MEKRPAHKFTHSIVEELGGLIVRGDAPAGESLPIEADLAKQFGASRTIVREAVKMLTAKGLVGSRPRRGTYVEPENAWNLLDPDILRWTLQRGFSKKLMREFLVVRKGIEPLAASEAAKCGLPAEIKQIETCLNEMNVSSGGVEAALDADIAFHIAILRASGNRFISQFSAVVETALRYSIRITNEAKGVHKANVEDHALIFEAISRGDHVGASEAVNSLLAEAISLLDNVNHEELARRAAS